MKEIQVSATVRNNLGKASAKKIRYEGAVPAILYGTESPIHFSVNVAQVKHLIYTGDVFFVRLSLEGKDYMCILQDAQFHPVSEKLLHLDFLMIKENVPMVMEIPVKIEGTSPGVLMGGLMKLKYRKMKLKALPQDLPQEIVANISELNIGDSLRVKDIQIEKTEFLHPAEDSVISIRTSRVARKATSEDGAEEGGDATTEEPTGSEA